MNVRSLILVSCMLAAVPPVSAQERSGREGPVATARELYAAARYDEALAVLNGLNPAGEDAPVRKAIEQYRSLCLLALGRTEEAETAIAAVITTDPMFQPNEADASPRVRSAFSDVRQRLLPEIAATRYTAAKAAFDRKEHATAERLFRDLLTLINDPQMNGRLNDMRTLANGFLELSAAAAAPPPEPKKEEPPPPPTPAGPVPGRVYSAEDAQVVAPVVIRQDVPRVPASILPQTRDRGIIEITIDEQGRVISVVVRTSVHAAYDPLLMNAAREWRYQPATFNGVPVRFRKLIQVAVDKRGG
jgi:TonB family protein